MNTDKTEWIEISRAPEMSTAQQKATETLASRGIRVEELSPRVIRLDVGQDKNRQPYYRVRVHKSVLISE